MLIKLDSQMHPTEAATAATVLSCLHSFEAKRRLDNVIALAGRYAR
jgi:hypothetical protein